VRLVGGSLSITTKAGNGTRVQVRILSAALGIDLNELKSTAHWLLINDEADISSCLIEPRPRLKLLPNTLDIQADDLLEAAKVNRELLLRKKLRPVLREFDVVVIDTPPAMRAATLNGLAVADTIVIPVDSSSFALLGLTQLLQVIAAIREAHKPDIVIRPLSTMFNRRQATVTNCTPCGPRTRNFPDYPSLPSARRTGVRADKAAS
jgi:cellulose biosynthesis protein BcsQ